MSNFWYFLGGCAAGALAVAAVQAFTEETCSSCNSSFSEDEEDQPHDATAERPCAADSTEQDTAKAQGSAAMGKGMHDTVATATVPDGAPTASMSEAKENEEGHAPLMPTDMQNMSEQIATSVIGIVSEFLRQSQAMAQRESEETSNPHGGDTAKPIIPNFAATQG